MWCSVSLFNYFYISHILSRWTRRRTFCSICHCRVLRTTGRAALDAMKFLYESLMCSYSSLDVQFWTTIGTKRLHAFVTFSSSGGATAALKGYIPPIWWGDGKKPQVRYISHFLNCPKWVLTKFPFGGHSDRSHGSTTLRTSKTINLCFSRVRIKKTLRVVRH